MLCVGSTSVQRSAMPTSRSQTGSEQYQNHQVSNERAPEWDSEIVFKCAESDFSLWSFVLFYTFNHLYFNNSSFLGGRGDYWLGKNWSCLTLYTKRKVSLHTKPSTHRFCFRPQTGTRSRRRGERGCFCFVGDLCSSWNHCFGIAFAKKNCTGAHACLEQTLQQQY